MKPEPTEAESAITETKNKYGRAGVLAVDGETFVLRPPTRGEFDSWHDSEKGTAENRQLVLDCLVYPARDKYLSVLDKYPAVRKDFFETAVELAGAGKANSRIVE